MHRQGERDDNFNAIKAILAMESLQIEGMYTHLAMEMCIRDSYHNHIAAYCLCALQGFEDAIKNIYAHRRGLFNLRWLSYRRYSTGYRRQ